MWQASQAWPQVLIRESDDSLWEQLSTQLPWREALANFVWDLVDRLDPEFPIMTVKKWGISFTFRGKHAGAVVKLLLGSRP